MENEESIRDEKGRWKKGCCGHVLTEEQARKGGQMTMADRIGRLFKLFDAKPLTAKEAVELDRWLLTKNKEELSLILKDNKQPIVVQARAQALMERKTTFEATEKMYNRAFGMPTQRQEIETKEIPPIVVNYVEGGEEDDR